MRVIVCFFILLSTLTGCGGSHYQANPSPYTPQPRELRHRSTTIIVDAGHGGKDQGSHKKSPYYEEKELTLATAKLLAIYLEQLGYNTIVTRGDDTFIPLDARCCFANSNKADLFVSVHYNAAGNADANGIEVFYYNEDKNKERIVASKGLAETVLGKLIAKTNAKSRGVKHGNFAVIRDTKMPAILVESGFLTNNKERERIMDPEYRSMIARSIAEGIKDYLQQNGIASRGARKTS